MATDSGDSGPFYSDILEYAIKIYSIGKRQLWVHL
jgi:hypothetical protein